MSARSSASTSLGSLMTRVGNGGKGISWDTKTEVHHLKALNGTVTEDGVTQGMARIDTAIDAAEVVLMLTAFVKLGIVETHAVFTVAPLLVVALSGPMLGERIGWRRWVAVGVGFIGVLVVLQPGFRVFSPWAILPLVSALMFAVYALLTRRVSAEDSAQVSFVWTGVAGAVGITLAGIWFAVPIARADWPWMAALCLTGAAGHYLLIRAYELAEASSLQPFAYTQLVWVSLIGVFLLGERVAPNVILGMVIIVGAGLFTWWRTLRRARTG